MKKHAPKNSKTFIVFRESLAQSILSDIITFGLIALCIYLARGDRVWTTFTLAVLLIVTYIRARIIISDDTYTFYSIDELQAYVDSLSPKVTRVPKQAQPENSIPMLVTKLTKEVELHLEDNKDRLDDPECFYSNLCLESELMLRNALNNTTSGELKKYPELFIYFPLIAQNLTTLIAKFGTGSFTHLARRNMYCSYIRYLKNGDRGDWVSEVCNYAPGLLGSQDDWYELINSLVKLIKGDPGALVLKLQEMEQLMIKGTR